MRGGKRGQHKGRERVLAENEDDIIARNMMEREEKKKRRDSDEEDSEESESSSEANESESEPDREEIMRNMPVEEKPRKPRRAVVDEEIHNLNRAPKKNNPQGERLEVQLSGRQKRELEEQKAKEAYFQKTLEGKTPEAKATLERLARIRAQREEAARRRKEQEEARAAMENRIKEQARLKNEGKK
ncbi:hypothetical protein AV274_3030 [Blastocystis sp. ATCC 50177/Nand II]|uniref:Casein kinase substrate phosphoprotein PP28 domain-containing protein n=1 Tax=Blastocystis sp. subtype 1 (strain ATCC 50177 / NandII) TaxID=478820 RepID=A0A196SE23_BLAHN|nr:hypothetical protein AV274_3030 [Blastocystis sp. ATCC 50177/Nand II]